MMDRRYWYVFIAMCCMVSASVGTCMNIGGIFYTPIADTLGTGIGAVTLSMSILSVVTNFTGMNVRRLLRRFSFKQVLFLSMVLLVSSTVLNAFCTNLFVLYILCAMRGVGVGLSNFVMATLLINNWYRKNHGTFTSFVMMFSGIPGLFLSPLFSRCITLYGWQNTYFVVAAIVILLDLPALLLPYTFTPEESGMKPYGAEEYEEFLKEKPSHSISDTPDDFRYLSRPFLTAALYTVLACVAAQLPQHLPGLAISRGFTAEQGALMLSFSMAGSVIIKIFFGTFADRFGNSKAIGLTALISALAILPLLFGHSFMFMEAAAFFYTFTGANSSVGIALIVTDMIGPQNYAKAYPLITFIGSMVGAFSGTIFGLLYDLAGTYTPTMVITCILQLLIIVVVFLGYRKQKA
ncbi:MAG: MFS transporter [Solobacterium sp.]|nr:MFS transporter [Solobacterium sp.]